MLSKLKKLLEPAFFEIHKDYDVMRTDSFKLWKKTLLDKGFTKTTRQACGSLTVKDDSDQKIAYWENANEQSIGYIADTPEDYNKWLEDYLTGEDSWMKL